MAIAGRIVAGALNHPSPLKEFERLLESSSTEEILNNACEIDEQFPSEAQKATTGGYNRVYWEGCIHRFAVRGALCIGDQW